LATPNTTFGLDLREKFVILHDCHNYYACHGFTKILK